MKISVIGTGYVGLVTGTCLAETGNEVVCVDIDKAKVEKMRNGIVPIYEPHLDVLFERNIFCDTQFKPMNNRIVMVLTKQHYFIFFNRVQHFLITCRFSA